MKGSVTTAQKTIKSYLYGLQEYLAFKKQDFEYLDTDNVEVHKAKLWQNTILQTKKFFLYARKLQKT